MALKIAVTGALGRMGRKVAELAFEDPRFEVVSLIEAPGRPGLGSRIGAAAGKGGIEVKTSLENGAEALIDFSSPAGFRTALVLCVQSKTAFVSGTTGLSQAELDLLVDASSVIPCFHAPNLSIGIEILSRLAAAVSGWLPPGFDVEIAEVHHSKKADAPSGTALRLAAAIAGEEARARLVHGRSGAPGPRKPPEIGVHAIRGGDVVGDHTIFFLGQGERIELVHRCTDRAVFARGALEAALKVAGRKPGLYGFKDIL